LTLKMQTAGLVCLSLCALVAPRAEAQDKWANKGFVNVNAGAQGGSHQIDTTSAFDIYGEQGAFATAQQVNGSGFFDMSGGYLVWDNLTLGLGYSAMTDKTDAGVAASVPHPAVRGQSRPVSASAPGLKNTQNALHLFGAWMMPMTDKIDLALSFGPSIFFVKQELPVISASDIAEPGPSITGVGTRSAKKTTAGINIGVDATYMVTKRIGAGVLARYTWGSASLEGADKLTVGGPQIAAGVRFRF
jgi:hypothetical protein